MKVKIKKLHPAAQMPSYASAGAACMDVYAMNGGVLRPNQHLVIGTGLAFEVPEGWCMEVFSRSGHGFNMGARLANCVGVLDADFRGELRICMYMDKRDFDGVESVSIAAGDRIAQIRICPVERIEWEEATALTETVRGAGGFGSSGGTGVAA